jgi:hypothetical protein
MTGSDGQTDVTPVFRKPVPRDEELEAEGLAESSGQDIRITEAADEAPPSESEEETGIVEVDTVLPAAVDSLVESDADHSWLGRTWLRLNPEHKSGSDALLAIVAEHGGDISLGLAALVLLGALLWVFLSRPVPATAGSANQVAQAQAHRKHRPKQPQLSLFERALVGLGLAEAPPPVPYMGEPQIQVWVDLNTGLYYCPGADLYGTTPKGKFTSQEDAQLDSFEPAYRRPCE